MSGSTGTVASRLPFIGHSWSAAATSGPSPRTAAAFPASPVFMLFWPSRAEVTQTLSPPTVLAIFAQVRPFSFLAAMIASVASLRVMDMATSFGAVWGTLPRACAPDKPAPGAAAH